MNKYERIRHNIMESTLLDYFYLVGTLDLEDDRYRNMLIKKHGNEVGNFLYMHLTDHYDLESEYEVLVNEVRS